LLDHRIINFLDKLPKKHHADAKKRLRQIVYAETREHAEKQKRTFQLWCKERHFEAAADCLNRGNRYVVGGGLRRVPCGPPVIDVDATDGPLHGDQEGRFLSRVLRPLLLSAVVFLLRGSVALRASAGGG
jgi:hypothetical protein